MREQTLKEDIVGTKGYFVSFTMACYFWKVTSCHIQLIGLQAHMISVFKNQATLRKTGASEETFAKVSKTGTLITAVD